LIRRCFSSLHKKIQQLASGSSILDQRFHTMKVRDVVESAGDLANLSSIKILWGLSKNRMAVGYYTEDVVELWRVFF
jgi:hypothetical protein